MDCLTGIHAVKEALEAQRPIDRIAIAKGRQDTRVEEIVQLARKQGVPVRFEDRGQLDRLANSRDHQGVVALAAARAAGTLEDILKVANASRGQRGLIVLLDGVEDPHNLGAVIRTALAAGAHGVVIPERRAAGLTDTVARASAGALAHLPVAKVTNLVRTMEELKEAGYWLVGLDEEGDKSYSEVDYTSLGSIETLMGESKITVGSFSNWLLSRCISLVMLIAGLILAVVNIQPFQLQFFLHGNALVDHRRHGFP